MNEITIDNANVLVKEYKGQRVVTFKDVDSVHGRTDGTARRNFNRNKKHFIEGEDYFKICANEIRTHKIADISPKVRDDVTFLTESGYLMLAKSFTDDKAWEVQRALVKSYFRGKSEQAVQEKPRICEKPYEYFDKFLDEMHTKLAFTVLDMVHFTGLSKESISTALVRGGLEDGQDYFKACGDTLKEFKRLNPRYGRNIPEVYIISESGARLLCKFLGIDVKLPEIEAVKPVQARNMVVGEAACSLMGYIRREIKGVEALTYLLESAASEDELTVFRSILFDKLSSVAHWRFDTASVKLGIHPASYDESNAIFHGERGIRI